jgi:hypothetical protein
MAERGTRPPRGYSREPFKPGHELSTTHGANSPRKVGPLAREYAAQFMESDSTPGYLISDKSYGPVIESYCRCLAVLTLLWAWFDDQDIASAMTDQTTEDEDEERTYVREAGEDDDGDERRGSKRRTRRRTVSSHVTSVLSELYRWEGRAITLRGRMGLDPLSRAKIGRDVAASKFDLAAAIAEIERAERSA